MSANRAGLRLIYFFKRLELPSPTVAAALDACTNVSVQALWPILRRHGRALPQERYLT